MNYFFDPYSTSAFCCCGFSFVMDEWLIRSTSCPSWTLLDPLKCCFSIDFQCGSPTHTRRARPKKGATEFLWSAIKQMFELLFCGRQRRRQTKLMDSVRTWNENPSENDWDCGYSPPYHRLPINWIACAKKEQENSLRSLNSNFQPSNFYRFSSSTFHVHRHRLVCRGNPKHSNWISTHSMRCYYGPVSYSPLNHIRNDAVLNPLQRIRCRIQRKYCQDQPTPLIHFELACRWKRKQINFIDWIEYTWTYPNFVLPNLCWTSV